MLSRGHFSATNAKPSVVAPKQIYQIPVLPASSVFTGTGAPTGTNGIPGSLYLDTSTSPPTQYVKSSGSNTWNIP